MFKLVKKSRVGRCDVKRCGEAHFETHTSSDGEVHQYCKTHGHEMAKATAGQGVQIDWSMSQQGAAEMAICRAQPAAVLGDGELVTPELLAQIDVARQSADAELSELRDIELETDDDVVFGERELARVRRVRKELDAKRKSVTQPLNASLRELNGWFRPALVALDDLSQEWDNALGKYRTKVEAARREQLRLAEEATKEAIALCAATPAQPVAAASDVRALQAVAHEAMLTAAAIQPAGQATYIDRWRWEVTDVSLIPREYLCPDERAIGAAVKDAGETTTIPGIRVWNDPIVRTRGAK